MGHGVIRQPTQQEQPAIADGQTAQLLAAGHGPERALQAGPEREARLVGRELLERLPEREGLLAGLASGFFVASRHALSELLQGPGQVAGAGRHGQRRVLGGQERPQPTRQGRVGTFELGQGLTRGREQARQPEGQAQHVRGVERARAVLERDRAVDEGLADRALQALAGRGRDLPCEQIQGAQAAQARTASAARTISEGADQLGRRLGESRVTLGAGRRLGEGLEQGEDRHRLDPPSQLEARPQLAEARDVLQGDPAASAGRVHFFISKPSWASSMVSMASSSTVAAKSGPS